MSRTSPSPIPRRRRSSAPVLVESGFVLILVLPVAMLLLMTALSLVSRSNSAAITASRESRGQAARMAAEYGFNTLMSLINTQYDATQANSFVDTENTIPGSPVSSYTILSLNLPLLPPACTETSNGQEVYVSILGKLTIGSTYYTHTISRTVRLCAPPANPNQLRVRSFN